MLFLIVFRECFSITFCIFLGESLSIGMVLYDSNVSFKAQTHSWCAAFALSTSLLRIKNAFSFTCTQCMNIIVAKPFICRYNIKIVDLSKSIALSLQY